MTPKPEAIGDWTDAYFNRTRGVVERFGDCRVTYAIFMRRDRLVRPGHVLNGHQVAGDGVSRARRGG